MRNKPAFLILLVFALHLFWNGCGCQEPYHWEDPHDHSIRQCIQCVAGDFLDLKWIMSNETVGQLMWWKDKWADTDCSSDRNYIIPHCRGTCVTIKIQELIDTEWTTEAVLMDCSDNLFIKTVDLPTTIKSRVYHEAFYSAIRSGFNITYTFVRADLATRKKASQNLNVKGKLKSFRRKDDMIKFIGCGLIGCLASFVFVGVYVCIKKCCCHVQYAKVVRYTRKHDFVTMGRSPWARPTRPLDVEDIYTSRLPGDDEDDVYAEITEYSRP